ncbi:MAG: S8 family serine peptidase [Ignavibacteria bacterium]|nr:S8 family serine peptidase [Ignavibacteria bacterium]
MVNLKLWMFFIFLIFSASIYTQEKYLIYFIDKGISLTSFHKNSTQYKTAEKLLSQKSIERRKKKMGTDYISEADVPVYEPYINQLSSTGAKIYNRLKWFNAVSVKATEDQIKKIQNFSFIEKIEKVKIFNYKNPYVSEQYENYQIKNGLKKTSGAIDYGYSINQLELSDVPIVHQNGINGQGILIGLLDTGFRWRGNPALSGRNVISEYDFVFQDTITADELSDYSGQDSHGTNVFSIAGGLWEGNIIGPAYGADFILAKTEDVRSETRLEEDNYAAALEWMEAAGVDITSSSLGYSIFDNASENYSYSDMNGNTSICTKAAEFAFQRGVLTITSAGNEGGSSWNYITAPADGFNTIAVGAVTNTNQIASFSSKGPTSDGRIKPDITAQGVGVYHATNSGMLSSGNGTSYSAPIVAGIAAQMLSVYPDLDNIQLRKLIQHSGDNYDTPDNVYGYGLLSAKRLLNHPVIIFGRGGLHVKKIFLDENGVKNETVKLYIKSNDVFTEITPQLESGKIHWYSLGSLNENEQIEFYYEYSDMLNNLKRSPAEGYYSYINYYQNIVSVESNNSSNNNIKNYFLSQNYPNPFNPRTIIGYRLLNSEYTTLKIYNMLGQEIAVLVDKVQPAGYYEVDFDASNLSSGVYFYRIEAGSFIQAKKMVFLK